MSGIEQYVTPFEGDPDERYEVIKYIGKGAYGFVELCKDHENGDKLVCKKVARAMDSTAAEILALFLSKHKHIIKFYNYYKTKLTQAMIDRYETIGLPLNTDMYGLIIEYGEGGDLSKYISKRKSMEEIILIKFIDQAVQAIHYINQHNNIHRDIKPENMLLDKYGNIKLADFGTVLTLEKNATHKKFTNIQGTCMYTAPEIYYAEKYDKKYNYLVDIYSLGICIYQACNNTISDKYIDNLKTNDNPKSIPEQYSDPFNDLVMDMISIDPTKRVNTSYIQEVLNQIVTPRQLKDNEQNIFDNSLKLFFGIDCVANKWQAVANFEYLSVLSTNESPEPVYMLALCYLYGEIKEKNLKEAIKLLRKAARKQYAPALKSLAFCYQNEIGVKKDLFSTIQLLTIAQKNDLEASFLLGTKYYKSSVLEINNIKEESKTSIKRDYELAFYYFLQAKDFIPAQNYLGLCYLNGNGTKKDIFNAHKYLSLSADGGNIDAMYNLAEFYLTQKSDDPFYTEKAINLLKEAANQYHMGAAFRLSKLYNEGTTVLLDEKMSSYYSKMNSKGPNSYDSMYSFTLFKLGVASGVEKNVYEAFSRLLICSENHAGATYRLAKCYKDGIGTQKDVNKAADLFEQASNNGILDATGDFALCLLKGEGRPVDKESAIRLLTESSELGSPHSTYILAQYYLHEDKQKAFELLRIAHSRGYINATYLLAHCLHHGEGIDPQKKNSLEILDEARDLFEQAASKNHIEACYELGMIYNKDQEVFANDQQAFTLFEKASKHNHPKATTELGILYQKGHGTKKNYIQAFKLFQKAESLGDTQATYHLSLCYLNGIGVEVNLEKARTLLEKASLENIVEAKTELGILYLKGIGGPEDQEKGAELLEEASNQGNMAAKVHLGKCYLNGIGRSIDNKKAFELFEESQKSDDIEGSYQLAKCYKKGLGTTVNIPKAKSIFKSLIDRKNHDRSMYELGSYLIENYNYDNELEEGVSLLSKAAKKGNPKAMNLLGVCFLNGNGVEKNSEQAVKCFRAAIAAGEKLGKVNLAQCYIEGNGTPLDMKKGYEMLHEAPQDDPAAKFRIGICLYKGAGVKQNKEKGLELLKEAALQDDKNALCYYGKLLLKGTDVKMDKKTAFSCFEKAANKGLPEARYQLGLMYENGDEIKKNEIKAQCLYQQSSDAGFHNASYRLGKMLFKNPLFIDKAIDLFEKAAKSYNIDALKELARIYEKGDGVPADLDKAHDFNMQIKQMNSINVPENMMRSTFSGKRRKRFIFQFPTLSKI